MLCQSAASSSSSSMYALHFSLPSAKPTTLSTQTLSVRFVVVVAPICWCHVGASTQAYVCIVNHVSKVADAFPDPSCVLAKDPLVSL